MTDAAWNKDTSIVPSGLPRRSRQADMTQQDDDFITCKTDAAWDKAGRKAGLVWVFFSGDKLESPIHGSTGQSFIGSPLIAEAVAMILALSMAISLEFSSLKVFSDNSTLIRAISGNIQSKEIIEIVSDNKDKKVLQAFSTL
ncbi:hypothetical protein Bca4012_074505 [Brassica carinata]